MKNEWIKAENYNTNNLINYFNSYEMIFVVAQYMLACYVGFGNDKVQKIKIFFFICETWLHDK